jgi:RHH-type proline utilization regulon transcriptional repressor/proline dehydrogenase/delta 1-pyrroline-5-carboxylate dehydrogenase
MTGTKTGTAKGQAARRWVFEAKDPGLAALAADVGKNYLADENETIRFLLGHADLPAAQAAAIAARARELVLAIRQRQENAGGLDALLGEYDLSSSEGIVLMCLAEALLRIPDATTADRLIADKLGTADWEAHVGDSESLFVNAATWGLMLTGRIVRPQAIAQPPSAFLVRLIARIGEPVVRAALRQAMKILGQQFVMGETIEAALQRAARATQYSYSFDMLGEAALTARDAERYFGAYRHAIDAAGAAKAGWGDDLQDLPSISVKLSALHPRYELAQSERALRELAGRLTELAAAAQTAGIALTMDAEEADRLELSLAIFERAFRDSALNSYPGLGLAVQAYQKRAWRVVSWLEELARSGRKVIPVRLVKGAYWDTEIKRAQEQGLVGYPVFTRKNNTDVSYLACAKALLTASPHLYPQFATHNAHTVAWLLEAGARRRFEFQRLHGMGEELYEELLSSRGFERRCRVYAPVGSHTHLLPYLVRRLLENGANTSFVNRIVHGNTAVDALAANPVQHAAAAGSHAHSRIALPRDLYAPERRNSRGWTVADANELAALQTSLEQAASRDWHASARVAGAARGPATRTVLDPADQRRAVGSVRDADAAIALEALAAAHAYHAQWNATAPSIRADILRGAADLFEADTGELVARCVAETGRTVVDSLAEVREAVDLLRYYAAQCERVIGAALELPGPTGEHNELRLTGRGVFACISPWNFPLAIFTGQIAAALAAGNTVLAKPAEQATLVAARAVELLERAGVPPAALHFVPGDGPAIGGALLRDARIAGVAFTGAVATAAAINRQLAERHGPLATLIAETGGINAMIVDSSALAEQVVRDAVASAFNSAGQRCSALRLLCLQNDTADEILRLLLGHLDELVIGDPAVLTTDVGPVIDADARHELAEYVTSRDSAVLYRGKLTGAHAHGLFFPPTVIAVNAVRDLTKEVFGPVLHVVRYGADRVDELVAAINALGFGLTLGVHTRIDEFARTIARTARVGNVYVNRNMIGAQVGAQPFGGMGWSGTGPKAGGPHYLLRFATEQTVTINTAAIGGNATLLSLESGVDTRT